MNRYRQGYLAELQLVRMLKESQEYHTVIRSAGSRSPFDVVAIGKSKILLCQVKTGVGKFQREQERLKLLPVPRCVSKWFLIYRHRTWQCFRLR